MQLRGLDTIFAAFLAGLLVLAGFRALHANNQEYGMEIARSLPVDAVKDIQAKGYSGPLYNDFNWGGYLAWTLHMPVTIDGRGGFYGDKSLNRSLATWSADVDWASDPALSSAGLVIGQVHAPLTQVLRLDPHFRLVYEDKVAAVFVAHR